MAKANKALLFALAAQVLFVLALSKTILNAGKIQHKEGQFSFAFPNIYANIKNEVKVDATQVKASDPYENYFKQSIDHFGRSRATFQQRYFINKKYAKNSQVHILYLEGATAASSDLVALDDYPHIVNAKDLQATVWCLEHRYYGKSQPFTNASVDNLKYLTVGNAIEDIASFITAQNQASGETNPKWILYGGFYAGSLALWFHQKYYGTLSFAVVSSSAPYQPTVDYYQYQKNVEDAYASYNPKCLEGFSRGYQILRQLIQNEEGRNNLTRALSLSPNLNTLDLTYDDLQLFTFTTAIFMHLPVQYNAVNVPNFGNSGAEIADVCAVFEKTGSTDYNNIINAIQLVSDVVYGANPQTKNVSYKKLLSLLELNDTPRKMLYQHCNELGLFVTTDFGDLALGSSLPNNYWIGLCSHVFGSNFNIDNLKSGVENLNIKYGSSNIYNAPNAIITHGSVDPWISAGATVVTDGTSAVYTIEGSGQTADIQRISDFDSDSLQSVRLNTATKLKNLLSNSNSAQAKFANLKAKTFDEKLTITVKNNVNVDKTVKKLKANINWNITAPNEEKLRQNVLERRKRAQLGDVSMKIARTNTFPRKMERLYEDYLLGAGPKIITTSPSGIYYGTIEQDLDHFDATSTQTFQQFFIYNTEFGDPKKETIFLMLGGEAPINWVYVSIYLTMGEFAMLYNADMYVLEHRFYGKSIPTKDISVDSLQYLSSEQALADAAVFVSSINSDKNYANPKWIVFGGSYPGNLAAWFRLKYPDLSVGAIASSAPVQAKVDFFEYLQVVNEAAKRYGEKNCDKSVHAFFKWHQQHLNSIDGRAKLSKIWDICPSWKQPYLSDKDVDLFLAGIVFALAGSVQYDDDGHSYLYYLCEVFEYFDSEILFTDADEDAQFAMVSKITQQLRPRLFPDVDFTEFNNTSTHKKNFRQHTRHPLDSSSSTEEWNEIFCWRANYQQYVDLLQLPSPFDSSDRCWIYQTCKELGVFQSTNMGPNIFESALPVNFQVDLCKDVFGPNFDRYGVDANVRFTNANYGGQTDYNGTNTVFVNGSEDPWHVLSVYPPYIKSNSQVTSILIEGTSHCADMYSFIIEEGPNVLKAKKNIKKSIRKWLKN